MISSPPTTSSTATTDGTIVANITAIALTARPVLGYCTEGDDSDYDGVIMMVVLILFIVGTPVAARVAVSAAVTCAAAVAAAGEGAETGV